MTASLAPEWIRSARHESCDHRGTMIAGARLGHGPRSGASAYGTLLNQAGGTPCHATGRRASVPTGSESARPLRENRGESSAAESIVRPGPRRAAVTIDERMLLEGGTNVVLLQPEERLQLAVLEDALSTFHRCSRVGSIRGRRLLAEVEAWFASDSSAGPFAFRSICAMLRLDPDHLRRRVRRPGVRLEPVVG